MRAQYRSNPHQTSTLSDRFRLVIRECQRRAQSLYPRAVFLTAWLRDRSKLFPVKEVKKLESETDEEHTLHK